MDASYYDPGIHFDIWDEALSDDELVIGLHTLIRSDHSLIKEAQSRASQPTLHYTSRLLALMAHRVLITEDEIYQ